MNDLFAAIYEFFFYRDQFSSAMYGQGEYATTGFMFVIISLLVMVTYYYLINHPAFSKWYHWLIVLGINFVINFIFGSYYSQSVMASLGYNFTWGVYWGFAFWHAILATCSFVFYSFTLRWWSSNCSTTPLNIRG